MNTENVARRIATEFDLSGAISAVRTHGHANRPAPGGGRCARRDRAGRRIHREQRAVPLGTWPHCEPENQCPLVPILPCEL